MLDLHTRRLRQFVVLAETLHFTKAARTLFVSQQGLSRSMAELERELGVALLERTTRSVHLTDAGVEFLVAARESLDALDRGVRDARRLTGALPSSLRVGFTVDAALELTPLILAEFARVHPDIEISLEGYGWNDPSCGLVSGDTDVAFVRLPVTLPNLRSEVLFTEPRAIGIPAHQDIPGTGPVTLRDIRHLEIAAPRTGDPAWRDFWTLRDTGHPVTELPQITRGTSSIDEELEYVSGGLCSTITVMSRRRFAPRPTVVYRMLADVAVSPLALAWQGEATIAIASFVHAAMIVRDREQALVAAFVGGSEP